MQVLTYGEEALGVELPAAVTLVITEAEPGVKGDTATGATKQATLETGLVRRRAAVHQPRRHDQGLHLRRRLPRTDRLRLALPGTAPRDASRGLPGSPGHPLPARADRGQPPPLADLGRGRGPQLHARGLRAHLLHPHRRRAPRRAALRLLPPAQHRPARADRRGRLGRRLRLALRLRAARRALLHRRLRAARGHRGAGRGVRAAARAVRGGRAARAGAQAPAASLPAARRRRHLARRRGAARRARRARPPLAARRGDRAADAGAGRGRRRADRRGLASTRRAGGAAAAAGRHHPRARRRGSRGPAGLQRGAGRPARSSPRPCPSSPPSATRPTPPSPTSSPTCARPPPRPPPSWSPPTAARSRSASTRSRGAARPGWRACCATPATASTGIPGRSSPGCPTSPRRGAPSSCARRPPHAPSTSGSARRASARRRSPGGLGALSPQATLERGYAVVERADGTLATSAAALRRGEAVALRLRDGVRAARIED